MNYKKDGMKKEEFFSEISQLANFCDVELVKSVYYGMIRVISRQLKGKGAVKMPDWGEFYLHLSAPKMTRNVHSGRMESLGMKNYVKFNPDYKVKGYFNGIR